MKKNNENSTFRTGILLGAGIIVAFLVFAAVTNNSNAATQNTAINTPLASTGADGVQVAKVFVQGSTYVMTPAAFKKGVPVRLEFDMSRVSGCARSVVIPAFGVRKYLNEVDNTVEFTPDSAGTFNIACSMNMYRGSFKVLESDGSQSSYVEQKAAAPAGGGCGCGGGGSGSCGAV